MKKAALITVVTCLLAGVVVFVSTAFAQDKNKAKAKAAVEAEVDQDWSKLKVVAYSSGLTGFFDPDTGKLYIYDSELNKCFIRQLTELGEPMKKIKEF